MQKGSKERDLTQGSVPKLLCVFSIPIIISNVFESLNASINTMWVGRFLGNSALAATADANFIIFLMFSLVFGFGLASSTFIGQYAGRQEMEGGRKVFGAAIGIVSLLSVVASIAGWYYSTFILRLLNTPQDVFTQAYAYLRVIFIALPPNLILWIILLSLRGIGNSVMAMWYMALTVILDIILNPLLIGGVGGYFKLGIAGSAYATAIANYVALTLQIVHLYIRNSPLCLRDAQLLYIFAPWKQIKRILLKGVPICLQMVCLASSGLIMISFVNIEGTNVLAAYNVCQQLWMYLQLPFMAFSSAVGAMAAQNLGAGHWKRVFSINRWGLFISAFLGCIMLLLFWFFDDVIFRFFFHTADSSDVISNAKHIQNLASSSYLLFGLSTIVMATLRANGVVFLPLIFIFLAVYPVRMGFYYAFYHQLGGDAIWLSFPVGAIFCFVITYLYYLTKGWRKTTLM